MAGDSHTVYPEMIKRCLSEEAVCIETPVEETMQFTANPTDAPTLTEKVPLSVPVFLVTCVPAPSVKVMLVELASFEMVNLITRTPDDPLSMLIYLSPVATFIVVGMPTSNNITGENELITAPTSILPWVFHRAPILTDAPLRKFLSHTEASN